MAHVDGHAVFAHYPTDLIDDLQSRGLNTKDLRWAAEEGA